jgi:hypothetical protein
MNQIIWKIEIRKISQLKDYYKNPRILTAKQELNLKRSLEKFGLIDKPILNLDNTIIGGHQRKRTLKKLGHKEIECWIPNRQLEKKEVEELNISLNQSGEFDFDILANQYDLVNLVEYGFYSDDIVHALEIDNQENKQKKEKKNKTCPHCGEEL